MQEKENIFGLLLFVAQRWTVNGDSLLMKKAGITTKQWMLLVILVKNFINEHPTISETAKLFGTSRQNLVQVAQLLQKKGFIDIKPDPNDFRIQRIMLTGKHEQYFEGEENQQWQSDYINSLFKGFSGEELKTFSSYMDRLITNI
jgi:DNA-binding MarR family transcriptional regulator